MIVQTWAKQVWLEENAELYGQGPMRPQSYPSCRKLKKAGSGQGSHPQERNTNGLSSSKRAVLQTYIIWTQQGIFINTYMHKIIISKKSGHDIEWYHVGRKGYVGEFGVRKGKRKMKLNYNLKNKNILKSIIYI